MTLHSPLADNNADYASADSATPASSPMTLGMAAPRTLEQTDAPSADDQTNDLQAPLAEPSIPSETLQEEASEANAEIHVEPETQAEPEVISEPEAAPTNLFAQFDLPESVMAAIEKSGYTTPTPIQEAMIPHVLAGRDVLGQAQTGTGKTAAFALPLLSGLDTHQRNPQILVLTPTRELAIQVSEAFSTYGRGLSGLRMATLYGGQGYDTQLRQLRKGAQIVVGTPGRVMDHMRKGSLNVDELKTLVLDEADEMLRMGFIEDVEWVLDQIPDERQLALFSATMPSAIHRLARKYLENPVEIKIDAKQLTADTVRQRWWLVRGFDKRTALVRLLEGEDTDGVLVFVRTKADTVKVSDFLANKGLQSAPLNGDMPQVQREQTVERLRNGKLNIVVATDVAARGLDVQRISHVINYDIPFDSESYVHRIGRTGRAGRSGDAILFVNRSEMHLLRGLQQHAGSQFETLELPDAEAINQKRIQRFESQITRSLEKDIAFYKQMIMEYVRDNDVELEEVAGALAYLAQGGKGFLLPPDPIEVSEPVEKALLNKKGRKNTVATREDRETLDKGLVTYRIEVGRRHGANPSQIVGAIANEGNIHSRKIGRIKIFTDFTLVDLPQSQENELLRSLSSTEISGQAMNLRRDTGGGGSSNNYSSGFNKDSSSGYKDSGSGYRSGGSGYKDSGSGYKDSGSGYNDSGSSYRDKDVRAPRRSKTPPIAKGSGSKYSSYNSSKPFVGNKKPKKQHRKGF